jgi:hypothetical protein
MRVGGLLLGLLVLGPIRASAEWQIRPFVGVTNGGGTTLIDNEHAAGKPNIAFGASGGLLGDLFGVEGDLGFAPGFFEYGERHPGNDLVTASHVTTLTGNVVVALPRRLAEYTLRPYFVSGMGLMNVKADGGFPIARRLAAVDVGGGVTGFLTKRAGISWDVRYFHSVGGKDDNGVSFVNEQLSFWRVNMALAIRLGVRKE